MTQAPTIPPPTRGRRGVSRRVRLRRTIAGLVVLLLATVVTVRLITRGGETEPAAVTTTSSSAVVAPTTHATAPGNEDGSSATEASAVRTTVPQSGNGKLTVVSVPPMKNDATGRAVHYTVEIEGGLGVDPAEVAHTVETVLLDPKGWQKVDGVKFVNVSPGEAAAGRAVDIRVTLASPALTDKLCAPMRTLSQVSCWNGERSVLNFRRWALGDDSYGDDVARYRIYQVNHEVGHGLGHGHEQCPAKGERAPIMVQQTLSLGGCTPWPYPSGT